MSSYVKEGYMKKLGGAMNTTWQPRFFSVTADGICRYYSRSDRKDLKGTFDLRPPTSVVVILRKNIQVIELKPQNMKKKFLLMSDNAEEQASWLDVFKTYSAGMTMKPPADDEAEMTELKLDRSPYKSDKIKKRGDTTQDIIDSEDDSDEGMTLAADAERGGGDVIAPLRNSSRMMQNSKKHAPRRSMMSRKSVQWFFSKEEQQSMKHEPMKTGMLLKKQDTSNEFNSYYFRLLPVGIFEMHDNPSSKSAKATISLVNAKIVADSKMTYNKNAITIVPNETSLSSTSAQVWVVAAADAAEQKQWIDALCRCATTVSVSSSDGNNGKKLKQGSRKEGYMSSLTIEDEYYVWNRYFFALDGNQSLNSYAAAKDTDTGKPVENMPISEVHIQLITADTYYRAGTFSLIDKYGRSRILSADTDAEAQAWIAAILN